jgi:hypothetical protein
LTSNRLLQQKELTCIASLCEPSSSETLLTRLEENGDLALYQQLRRHPDIEPKLTETVKRYFQRITLHGKPPAGPPRFDDESRLVALRLPLAHGLAEAMSEGLMVHRWLNPTAGARYAETLASYFQLPTSIKRDSKEAAAFLLNLQPEHCHWDPLTRLWISTQP